MVCATGSNARSDALRCSTWPIIPVAYATQTVLELDVRLAISASGAGSLGSVTRRTVKRLWASTPVRMRLSDAAVPGYWLFGPIQRTPPERATRIANGYGPAVTTRPETRSMRASLVSVAFESAPSLVGGA